MEFTNISIYMADREAAITALASCLQQGFLSLFLGAGVSYDFKFPTWEALIDTCRARRNLQNNSAGMSLADYIVSMNSVESSYASFNDPSYFQLVHDALYAGVDVGDDAMCSNLLLSSIAAMIMGSRFGSVKSVFTTNYDNVLETYLKLHGFRTESVVDPFQLIGNADSIVYHPHGFLPYQQSQKFGKHLVFSESSYSRYLRTGIAEPWPGLVYRTMSSSVPLFIGTKLRDPIARFYFANLADLQIVPRSVLGFLLIKGPLTHEQKSEYKASKIVPIEVDDYAFLHKIIFEICRKAREIV